MPIKEGINPLTLRTPNQPDVTFCRIWAGKDGVVSKPFTIAIHGPDQPVKAAVIVHEDKFIDAMGHLFPRGELADAHIADSDSTKDVPAAGELSKAPITCGGQTPAIPGMPALERPRIVALVRGGVLCSVWSNIPGLTVELHDADNVERPVQLTPGKFDGDMAANHKAREDFDKKLEAATKDLLVVF